MSQIQNFKLCAIFLLFRANHAKTAKKKYDIILFT